MISFSQWRGGRTEEGTRVVQLKEERKKEGGGGGGGREEKTELFPYSFGRHRRHPMHSTRLKSLQFPHS